MGQLIAALRKDGFRKIVFAQLSDSIESKAYYVEQTTIRIRLPKPFLSGNRSKLQQQLNVASYYVIVWKTQIQTH